MSNNKNSSKNIIILLVLAFLVVIIGGSWYLGIWPEKLPAFAPAIAPADKPDEAAQVIAQNQAVMNEVPSGEQGEVTPINDEDNYRGDLKAAVALIVYDDLTSPYSGEFAKASDRVFTEHERDIIFAHRHFFVEQNVANMTAALALECAGEQDKFWDMRAALIATATLGNFTNDLAKSMVKELGLNKNNFNKCLDEKKYEEKILNQIKEARSAWVTGAPTFFVNGRIYVGAYPYDDFTRSDGTSERGIKNIVLDALGKNEVK